MTSQMYTLLNLQFIFFIIKQTLKKKSAIQKIKPGYQAEKTQQVLESWQVINTDKVLALWNSRTGFLSLSIPYQGWAII